MVWLSAGTTAADLAHLLGWSPAKTQRTIYLNGGGIVSNLSVVDFKTARTLIRAMGREAGLTGQVETTRYFNDIETEPDGEKNRLWKERATFWLSAAVNQFIRPGRLALEAATIFTEMAASQLILAHVPVLVLPGELERFRDGDALKTEWRETIFRFLLPVGEKPDAIELALLNDLHTVRNDIIHGIHEFGLAKDSVYLWLFLATALSTQFGVRLDLSPQELSPFLAVTELADEKIRMACIEYLAGFVPSLLESMLGPITVRLNSEKELGLSNDQGRAYLPDFVIETKDKKRYSAQVEVSTTINVGTAQWWKYHDPSLVFIPLGYLAQARYWARLAGYPEDRLIAYISPSVLQ